MALCVALGGLPFGLIPILFPVALAAGMVGVTLAVIGLIRTRQRRRPRRGMAIAALVVGVLAFGLGVMGAVIVDNAVTDLNTALTELESTEVR